MASDESGTRERQVDLVVLVLGSATPPHHENEQVQRLTWASSVPPGCVVHWLIGDPRVNAATPLPDGTVLFPYPDEFDMMLAKGRAGLQWALERYAASHILRTNSSSYLDLQLLVSEVSKLPLKGVYRGVPGAYASPARGEIPFVSGASIVMSRDVAAIAATVDPNDYADVLEDVAIGHHLQKYGMAITPHIRLDISSVSVCHLLQKSSYVRLKSYRSNSLTRKRMNEVHSVAVASSSRERIRLLAGHDRREVVRRHLDRMDSWRGVVEKPSLRAALHFLVRVLNIKVVATDILTRRRSRNERAATYDPDGVVPSLHRQVAEAKEGLG